MKSIITEVKIIKMKGKGKLLGYANVVINNSIVLKGIRIIDGDKGRFLSMPAKKNVKSDKPLFYEHFHPITSEAREMLMESVFDAYDNITED